MALRLIVDGLAAYRGEDLIFRDLSFTVAAGGILVITGPNGAGKSTLLRVLAGLLPSEAGTIRLEGADSPRVCEACHYLGHRNAMKRELSVAENLSFWRAFLGQAPGGQGMTIDAAIAAVGLRGIGHLPFGYLSAGQQRRMAMAKLLVAYRPVWILDEPTAALDVEADRLFAGLIDGHCETGGIVLAATHQPLGLDNVQSLVISGLAWA